jgi:CheY-like chemotaxis protein
MCERRSILEGVSKEVDIAPRSTLHTVFRDAPILVVDDDRAARRSLCAVLDQIGYDTVEADDGIEAQVALACHRVSVIFLDLQLPYMNGRELLRRIAHEGDSTRVPVVVLSGVSDTWDRVSCKGLGVSAFLRKPVERASIERTLARLGLRPGRRQTAQESASKSCRPIKAASASGSTGLT